MITVQNIKDANSQSELNELVEKTAFEHDCQLSESMTFLEQACFFGEETCAGNDLRPIAVILRAAEVRWFELEK